MALRLDKHVEAELRSIEGNQVCCDCEERGPQWASVSFGVFMCLECSGRHRSLGVHISFVRSVSMDSWSEKQIAMMRTGGNAKCIRYLAAGGVAKNTPIAPKYNSPHALLYKERLLAEVEGRELPTHLPQSSQPTGGSNNGRAAAVSGSDPLPGESEQQYVARQRQLQEEARERMRAKFGSSQGLRSGSGGAMSGIGSDPSYNPGSRGSGDSDISAQLGDVSQKAYSYFSSVWETTAKTVKDAHIAEQVTSTWGSLTSGGRGAGAGRGESPASFRARESSPAQGSMIDLPEGGSYYGGSGGSPASGGDDPLVAGWSALSSGAMGLWNKASAVVSDLVEEPSEEDYRFPRAQGSSPAPAAAPAAPFPASRGTHCSPSVTPPKSGGSGGSTRSSNISDTWDDLGAVGEGLPPRGGVRASHSDPALVQGYGNSSSNSMPRVSSGSAINRGSSPLAATSGTASKSLLEDDDFFNSFGVK